MTELAIVSPLPSSLSSNQSVVDYFLSQESPGTQRTYGSAIRAFFAWCNMDYKTITPFQALDYDSYLKATVAPSTVQRHISTLTRFFAFAMKCGLVQTNPFAAVKQKRVPNRAAERFITAKELSKLLDELKKAGMREYVLGLLLASTGMRVSEVHGLSWNSFMEGPDGSILVNVLRKGGSYQLLPLREDVWDVLKAYMVREIDAQDNSPLFLNPSGQRASVESLRTWIREGAKRAGIKKAVSPHTLRHTFASLSLSNGASLQDVQAYLNHSSVTITQIYLHPQNMKVGEYMPIEI